MNNLKRTALYDVCSAIQGSRYTDFGGWEMPIHFSGGILDEHRAVRKEAGLFDVSHMGEIHVEGEGAKDFLNYLVTNRIDGMKEGECVYTPMCRDDGGTVDDLLVYALSEEEYLLVVNASTTAKDFQWIQSVAEKRGVDVRIEDISEHWAQLALQGPKALTIMNKLAGDSFNPAELASFRFIRTGSLSEKLPGLPAAQNVIISRTGYTGEDGFEIYCAPDKAGFLWNFLTEAGARPCGLGARDMLRLEACLALYGHELSDNINPLEAGLNYFVKLDKGDFCGRRVLAEQKSNGVPRRLYGLEMIDQGVPREGYAVYKSIDDNRPVGTITSGGKSPERGTFIALALADNASLEPGGTAAIEIRGKRKNARVIKTPFYRRKK